MLQLFNQAEQMLPSIYLIAVDYYATRLAMNVHMFRNLHRLLCVPRTVQEQ